MKLKYKELTKNIYWGIFESKRQLAKTFLRFQEYFESPKFKGKIFNFHEFKKWYVTNSPLGKKTGKFTYYTDWDGFNIPSKILEPFYKGKFNPLSKEEKTLLGLFKDKRNKKFYIIATYKKSGKHTLQHEIAHGLFYTNSKYKKEVIKVLKKCNPKIKEEIIDKYLSKYGGGYHPSVWIDETHAHIVANLGFLKRQGINSNKLLKINKDLNKIFNKYSKS